MAYVDAQAQSTQAYALQTSFGAFNIGPKTVGVARDVSSSATSSSRADGYQSVVPTAAKGGSAFGPESEFAPLASPGEAPAKINWLGIASLAVGVVSVALVFILRRSR